MRTTSLLAILITIVTLVGALTAQPPQASVTIYGSGCRPFDNSEAAPVILVNGLPQLGATVTVRYLGPNSWPGRLPILITGSSNANIPVPRLTQHMAAICTLLVLPDIAVIPMPIAPTPPLAYLDRIAYQIPNVPSVVSASVFHQWVTFATNGLDPLNQQFVYLLLSNGAQVTAGL